jgi:hypothetical protein
MLDLCKPPEEDDTNFEMSEVQKPKSDKCPRPSYCSFLEVIECGLIMSREAVLMILSSPWDLPDVR